MKIVVTEFMEEAALEGVGAEVVYDPTLVDDRARMLAALSDADAVIVRNRTEVDGELLAAAPKLRAVGRLGVGLDNIDLEACERRGVSVHPATGANTLSVVEYVIGAALALVRGAFASNRAMLAGEWPRGALGKGGEIAGRTMGLVGYGGIARAVRERAEALGMRVVWYDPMVEGGVALDALLAEADVVSLHVPLTDGTRGMIGAAALARMKPGAVLVNTARGGVVDEEALADALRAGRLGGRGAGRVRAGAADAGGGGEVRGVPEPDPHAACGGGDGRGKRAGERGDGGECDGGFGWVRGSALR